MPLRVFNTFGNSTVGPTVVANSGDVIIVTRTGTLVNEGGFNTILVDASNVDVTVNGEVYGDYAILTQHNLSLLIGTTGSVHGVVRGVFMYGGNIVNHGSLSAEIAVVSFSDQALALSNTGTIAGLSGIAISSSIGADSIVNSGLIQGSITMGGGDDTYDGDGGRVIGRIDMGSGSDLAEGGNFRETFVSFETDGNDVYYGGGGIDTYDARSSGVNMRADLLRGTVTFAATGAIDVVAGIENVRAGSGRDTLLGSRDANTLWGGAGNDGLFGRSGNDLLYGENGNDGLDGSTGDDTLVGGFGDDRMSAGDGDDLLISDGGRDTLTGGAGIDTFVFTGPLDRAGGTYVADRITDFQVGQDQIDLTSLDAHLGIVGNQAFTWVGTAVVTAAGQAGYVNAAGVTRLWVYVDGALPLQRQAIVELTGTIVLTANDVLL